MNLHSLYGLIPSVPSQTRQAGLAQINNHLFHTLLPRVVRPSTGPILVSAYDY